jgi:adenine phosphoribosyltransferase
VHEDAFKAGENVLVTDDLLATGGTLSASCKLVEKLGANVFSIAVLIDLEFLHGRDKLKNYDIFSVIKY